MVTAPTVAVEQVICDWIVSLGWDNRQELGFPLYATPEILTDPDKAVFITGTGGPGYVTEEPTADAVTFQARVRGPADDPIAARLAADTLDALILSAPFPVQVDGTTVVHVHRLAGRPSMLPLDEADKRFELTASYVIVIGVLWLPDRGLPSSPPCSIPALRRRCSRSTRRSARPVSTRQAREGPRSPPPGARTWA